MPIQRYGLDLQLPAGDSTNLLMQVKEEIALEVPVLDHDHELLIFEMEAAIPLVLEILEHYRIPSEPSLLLQFTPETETLEKGVLFEDYILVTQADHYYLDLKLASIFSLNRAKPEAEPAPALLQLEEHLIGVIKSNDNSNGYLIDQQLAELAERIAQVYGCHCHWLYSHPAL